MVEPSYAGPKVYAITTHLQWTSLLSLVNLLVKLVIAEMSEIAEQTLNAFFIIIRVQFNLPGVRAVLLSIPVFLLT